MIATVGSQTHPAAAAPPFASPHSSSPRRRVKQEDRPRCARASLADAHGTRPRLFLFFSPSPPPSLSLCLSLF